MCPPDAMPTDRTRWDMASFEPVGVSFRPNARSGKMLFAGYVAIQATMRIIQMGISDCLCLVFPIRHRSLKCLYGRLITANHLAPEPAAIQSMGSAVACRA